MGKLTDLAVRKAKPREAEYKLSVGRGLFLVVTPTGGKSWRLDYRHGGRRKSLRLGKYPDLSLAHAEERAVIERRKIAEGQDPAAEKAKRKAAEKAARIEEAQKEIEDAFTFRKLADQWLAENARHKPRTARKWEFFLRHACRHIGDLPARQIMAADLVRMVKQLTDLPETARRVFSTVARVFRYAVAHGLTARNPAAEVKLGDIAQFAASKHHASVTEPKAIGALMRAIDGYEGSIVTRYALQLSALTFVRPGELRHAEWSEIDPEAAEWRIPAEKMKIKAIHIVPLARQALAVLEALRPHTGGGKYLFPSERTDTRAMSENTVGAALRRMGYASEEMTAHGFRSMASTRLHELGFPHLVIERQLAHAERNAVTAAYNFAEYLPERRKMMQTWADHLDALKAGGSVIPFRGSVAS